MTLQEHKEKEAQEKNTFHPDSPANEYFRRGFISGFDQADPIGFAEWMIKGLYDFECKPTEELYLKFIEYKQKQQA